MEMIVMNGSDLIIKKKLEELYPNKVVKNITTKHNSLYQQIRSRYKEEGLDLGGYIESLGFIYNFGWKEEFTDIKAKDILLKLFPNRKISSISNLYQNNSSLYRFIKQKSDDEGISVSDYLKKLGFENNNLNENFNHEINAIKKLNMEYGASKSELSRIIGTTKQNLDQKLKKINNVLYKSDEFTDKEIELIISMIWLREHYYEDKSLEICMKIYHEINNTSKYAILYKENLKIKVCFDLPDIIINEMYKFEFHKYQEQDMELLKIMNSNDGSIEKLIDEDNENDELTTAYIVDSRLRSKINARAKSLGMSLEAYYKFLGFKILNKRKYADKYIKDLLGQYKLDNNIIKIPIQSKDYIRIFRIAKNRGYKGLEEFVTSYGFKYERLVSTEDINEKYKNIIEQRYIVENKKIYIHSLDPFYNRISSYSYKNNMSLDEYIMKLGFYRIDSVNELPENYIQYDWKKDVILNDNSFESTLLFLDEIANENNEIYIDTESKEYWNLWKIANVRNISVNDLIEMLGYKRIYACEAHKIERQHIKEEETANDEKKYIDELLNDLEKIQGSLDKVNNENEKINKNQALVKKIKRLYHSKCQLCCTDENGFSVPPIEKEDGELYVEVHHIKQISEVLKINDESNMLIDSYKNVIVVCSYHHKYLHYYHGGFKDIIQEKDSQLYFKSKLGDKIKIYTNYHLNATSMGHIV
jgi:hypothetical protein